MATFQVPVKIGKYAPVVSGARNCGDMASVPALVDNTPGFSMFPASLLTKLGVEPLGRARFDEVDGGISEYHTGTALLEVAGKQRPCQVIFGPEGQCLLRKGTLGAFGLQVDSEGAGLEPAVLHLPTLIAVAGPAEVAGDVQ